ncbi:MAG: putative nitrogen fixation protein NifT [Aquificaceae bacterium]
MKATFRKNKDGHLEVYIPKKDIEAIVVDILKNGSWGGVFKLSNGWVLQVPSFESEPRFPITIEVKKISV